MTSPAIAALVSMLVIGSGAAHAADTPARVFAAYGMTGVWSSGCDRPVTPSNPRTTYDPRPDGLVAIMFETGADSTRPSTVTVTTAEIDDGHRLHVTDHSMFEGSEVTIRRVLLLADDGGLRTVSVDVINPDGSTQRLVSDGSLLDPDTHAPFARLPAEFKCPR